MSHIGRTGHNPGLVDTLDGKQEPGVATPDLAGLVHFTIGPLAQHLKKKNELGWANIRHIFNIRIMNIFDFLFEYSNIIRIFYVIKFYNIKFVIIFFLN
jgi:hypothetical protein